MTQSTAPEPFRAGYFGEFGGRFVAETLVVALAELERALDLEVDARQKLARSARPKEPPA